MYPDYSKTRNKLLILAGIFLLAFFIRLFAAIPLKYFPGDSDVCFHLSLAKNLANGKGFVYDSIWTYFGHPTAVSGPQNLGIWMPLASICYSLFFRVFGISLRSAQLCSILLGSLVVILCYFTVYELCKDRMISLFAALFAILNPKLIIYSIAPQSRIFTALFGIIFLFSLCKAYNSDYRWIYISSVFAGLAHLARGDGLIFVFTMIVVFLIIKRERKIPLRVLFYSLTVYLIVISPWLLRNYMSFGSIWIKDFRRLFFLQRGADFSRFHLETLNFNNYLKLGIFELLRIRLIALKTIIFPFRTLLTLPILVFIPFGIIKIKKTFIPFIVHLVSTILIYPFFLPHSRLATAIPMLATMIPFFLCLSLFGIMWLSKLGEKLIRLPYRLASNVIIVIILLFSIYARLYRDIIRHPIMYEQCKRIEERLKDIGRVIKADCEGEPIVMIWSSTGFLYETGIRGVEIPSDDLNTVFEVAEKFGTEYLILQGNIYTPGLYEIYTGERKDERLKLLYEKGRIQIFKFVNLHRNKTKD